MCRIILWLALLSVAVALSAQDNSVHFVPADQVAVRVMRDVPPIDLAPGVHVRTVVGATGSFSLGEFDPGGVAPLHHHTREQADVGISGMFDVTLSNHVEVLRPGAGMIIPANVRHSIANIRGGLMTVIEFHTVRRPDLVPPRPAMTFSASAEPVALQRERQIVVPLDGPVQSSPAGMISGETCTLAWRRLPTGAPPTSLHPAALQTELFAYIVQGDAELVASERAQPVSAGMLLVIPASVRNVTLRAAGATDVAIVEFSPERAANR